MNEIAPKPRRRIVWIGKIEADDWNRLSDELAHMSREVDRGNMRNTSIMGGYSCGHIVVASEDGSMDHDTWFKDLNEYLEKIKAAEVRSGSDMKIGIVERLRFDATRCELQFSKGVAGNISEAADEIERLRAYIWSLDGKTIGTPSGDNTLIDEGIIVASDIVPR